MGVKPSRYANRDRRWPALRLQALRRDDFKCVKCGTRGRLEVDHIQPVAERPDLAFELSNVQSLCPWCHVVKTRKEMGLPEPNPERKKWKLLVANMQNK
jgi:5-methylcytosine-specific restriction endonuclease McrA